MLRDKLKVNPIDANLDSRNATQLQQQQVLDIILEQYIANLKTKYRKPGMHTQSLAYTYSSEIYHIRYSKTNCTLTKC